jgi:DNA topoisomerase-1
MVKIRLHHSTDDRPGFTRKKVGINFVFFDLHDRVIKNLKVITRCQGLGIPPAYTAVWISADPRGHLQATARDHRGRKQYFYHPAWQAHQEQTKFEHLLDFARVLGLIRRHVVRDLGLRGMPKHKVVAAIVRLLDTKYIRIGNEVYAHANRSYGLTTLLRRHLFGRGKGLHLVFKGKSGIRHDVALDDERIRKIAVACQDLPGQDLFEYVDHVGEVHSVRSDDVNSYLQTITQSDITAKDFRTWHGTVIAATFLSAASPETKLSAKRRQVVAAVKLAAAALGNTPAVCKRCYIDPRVIDNYLTGGLPHGKSINRISRSYPGLLRDEYRLVEMLEKW